MNNIHKYVIRTADTVLNMFVVLVLCIVGLYSVYCLWDNNQIIQEAENVQEDILKYKPEVTEDGPSFQEIMAINPDVCAWVTMYDTQIDYPIVQGEDNQTYISMNVFGEFALAGSIFLDTRNSRDFTDAYSLIYGHHMANNKMFGDLDLYKEVDFFEKSREGILLLPGKTHDLEVLACMVVESSDKVIFEPDKWKNSVDTVLNYAERNALHINEELLNKVKGQEDLQIISLSTCSNESEEARTIVLAVMKPYISSE